MIKVNLNGVKSLQDRLKSIPKILQAEVGAEIRIAAQNMAANAQREAPSGVGNILKSGISSKKLTPLQYEVTSNAHYSAYVEFGTKGRYKPQPGVDASNFKSSGAGKTGKGFYDAILQWVKIKRIAGTYSVKTRRRTGKKIEKQIEDEQTAFAIYVSIMRHGIKPQPFFFKQVAVVEPQLIKNIENVLKDL